MEIVSSTISDVDPVTESLLDPNRTAFHLGPKRDQLYIVIPITILYSLIFFTGVVGNVVTCIVIRKNKHMHTATNYYLFSLAVSDLLLLVSGLPQEIYSIWSRYPYIFGEAFCILRGLAAEMSANATVLTITAFTVERYVAICHPFLSHTMSKLSRAIKLILMIWVVALSFAIPQALQFGVVQRPDPQHAMCTIKNVIIEHSFEVSTFLFFVAPMTLITVLYALIGLKLRRTNVMKKKRSNVSQQQTQSSKRVLKMLVAVVVAFFICWAPFHAQRLLAIYGSAPHHNMLKIYEIITYISGILYYVSTTINPILYHIMSHKFREAFKDTLTRCCGISKGRVKRTYSVLSRSRNAQDSTDYSISKDEYLPSNSHSTVKTSLESRNFSNSSFRETNRNGFSNGDGSRRPLSVVVNSRYGEVRTVVREERKNIFRSPRQRSSKLEIPTANHGHRKRTKRRRQNERLLRLWNFLVCHAENNLAPQAGSPFAASPEAFNMSPVDCRSLSNASDRSNNHSNISNSSLKDVDRRALEDELSTYMEELKKKSGPE